jgi:outer membrane protein assembly factor BamE
VDAFHRDRWDYVYTMEKEGEALPGHRFSVYFEDDRLARLEGDFRPQPAPADDTLVRSETVVSVPDYTGEKEGLISRALDSIGLGGD